MVKTETSIIIKNGLILTMNPGRQIFQNGFVRILGDSILELGEGEPGTSSTDEIILDARSGIVMPGMVNTHTHIAMSLFRSLADDRADRLRKVLFPLEKKFVTPELVYWASLHTLVEMIQGGVTCFADMYYFEHRVAEATEQAGLRCILGETVIDFPSPDTPNPYGGLEIAESLIQQYRNHPLITPAVAPHAPYSLDEDSLRSCGRLSADTDIPFLIHLAEMPFEMEQFKREKGLSPVGWMDELDLVNRRMVAAHCIFVDSKDIDTLKRGDAGIAHNMVANIKSGKGVAPVPEMLEHGLRIGLGTDGPMSGNTMDIINQLGYVAKVHKFIHRNPTSMPAREVVVLATIGGARALHLDGITGSLEPGKKADIIIVSTEVASMTPLYDPWSALVYGASPRDVSTVIVNGRIIMKERIISHLNLDEINLKCREFSDDIRRAVGSL